jgi:hypothetical protein
MKFAFEKEKLKIITSFGDVVCKHNLDEFLRLLSDKDPTGGISKVAIMINDRVLTFKEENGVVQASFYRYIEEK